MVVVIKLADIRENPVALRSLQRTSESYKGLVESIKSKGFLGSITGRKKVDDKTAQTYYEVIDGLHRYNAAMDAGLTEIAMDVLDMSDADVLETQLMANIHKVDTRPGDYSKQLRRILAINPHLTEAELAVRLGKSPQWLSERLSLNKITDPNILELVNSGKIALFNAYALAKLPVEEQSNYVQSAMTDPPDQFVPKATARAKEIRESRRQGKDPNTAAEFQAVAYMQKMKDVKLERDTAVVGQTLVSELGCQTPLDGWNAALDWMLHMDPRSIETQKAKEAQRKAESEEAAKKRKLEREQKKQKEAAEAAAKLKDELGTESTQA